MAEQKIPYEFQSDFGQAAQLEEIARAMEAQRALINRRMEPQMVSGHYIRMSPMQGLADMFAAYQGGRARSEAAKIRQGTTDRMAADERGQLGRIAELMLGRPEQAGPVHPSNPNELAAVPPNPLAATRFAAGSTSPRVQDFGKSIGETVKNQTSAFASQLTPEGLQYMAQYGAVPPQDPKMWKQEPKWGPVQNVAPPGQDPILAAVRTDTNEPKFAPKPNTTTVTVGEKGSGRLVEAEFNRLRGEKGVERAASLQRTLDSGQAALALALEAPVNFGVESSIKTFAQSLSSITGAPVDPSVPATQLYTSFVIPQIAEIIKMFGAGTGISDQDRKAAERALALATNDPRMVQVALVYGLRGAMKEASRYNEDLDRGAKAAISAGYDPQLFEAKIPIQVVFPKGLNLPNEIFKPGVLEKWAVGRIGGTPLDDAMKRNRGAGGQF